MSKHVRQSTAVDSSVIPGPSASTVKAIRCLCDNPHPGHERADLNAQMNAMGLGEDAENDVVSIAMQRTSTPPSTSRRVQLSDNTPRKMSSSNSTPETLQDERKEQIGQEIKNSKRVSASTASFRASFRTSRKTPIRKKLILFHCLPNENSISHPPPASTSSPDRVAWPDVPSERAYYPPLTALLNEIVDHFIGTPNPNKTNNVRFITYDKQMAPITPESLKPDLLLVEEVLALISPLRWKHPLVAAEVKRSFSDAIKQLGTYVREMYSARPGRQFCWGLFFDHSRSTFQVLLFTPDRVHYTRPSLITSEAGYREMVKIIVALISQENLLTIGEDSSRDSSTKLLPNGDRLQIQATEFDRKSIVGRRTRILSVIVGNDERGVSNSSSSLDKLVSTTSVSTQAPTSPPSEAAATSTLRRYHTRSVASPNQYTGAHHHFEISSSSQPSLQESSSELGAVGYVLKETRENPDEVMTFAANRDHLEDGEYLVIKESWPLSSRRDVEWQALRSCAGEFGVPEVVYRVVGKHPMSVACTREPRVPQHIALREKGLRLVEAGSPRILLTAVLHAIIGHWNLFQKGWLHRDVSIGNVLVLNTGVTKSPPTGLGCLGDLTECRGLLIDGDAMIQSDGDREPGSHRLCTPPFLSRRLVYAWRFEIKTFDQYFDDLESFAWVLLWSLIEIAEANEGATVFDRDWMQLLNADSLQGLETGKITIVSKLRKLAKGSWDAGSTSLSDPFIKILYQWFDLVEAKERFGNSEMLRSNEESTALYEAFITFAMTKMDELPEGWQFKSQLA